MNLSFPWWLPFGRVPEVKPQKLHQWLQDGRDVQLIDSRTEFEYHQGTIEDAVHVPVTNLPDGLNGLDLDPDKPLVFLCLSGHRSRPGTRLLRARGFEAYSMKGGISAWKINGYALSEPSRHDKEVDKPEKPA